MKKQEKYKVFKVIIYVFSNRIEMWLSILASVLSVGAASAVIYAVYLKINHPDVIFMDRKFLLDFFQDSFASLVQSEIPPFFQRRPSCSSGMFDEIGKYS